MKKLLVLFFVIHLIAGIARATDSLPDPIKSHEQKRINIFITSRSSRLDWTFTLRLRARLRSLFSKGNFFVIAGQNDSEIADRVISLMNRKNAMINSLWIDSHGHYGKARATFDLGISGFSYQTLKDTALNAQLRRINIYFDSASKIGIGSCYGGATFEFPAVENLPSRNLNGDSLMIYTSLLFNHATVFASESFVMMKPGVWHNGYALAGGPPNHDQLDILYKPVWERVGQWNRFNPISGSVEHINTVCIDKKGDILVKDKNYLSINKFRKRQAQRLKKLRSSRYNLALVYRHID